jgi:hypothetical protein
VAAIEDDTSLPPGCRPVEVAQLLDGLFDALNRRDDDAAAALVADRELLALLERPAAGRPLRLVAVIVDFANGLGQIEFRAADRLVGKGAIDCETRKVVATGLGAGHERAAVRWPPGVRSSLGLALEQRPGRFLDVRAQHVGTL